jgi:acetyl-CoA carboxylase biotin carboxylase subunit
VRYATEAYHIGPAAPKESYLNIEKLLDVAKRSGCDAVHPGYGFLSENPTFARACTAAGLTFIGPKPESMESMGTKTMARKLMAAANVPIVPGLEEGIEDEAEALKYAEEIGFPGDAEGGRRRRRQGHAQDRSCGGLLVRLARRPL